MDDASRENEGDIMALAENITLETVKKILRYSTGIVCATMTKEIADRLQLPLMIPKKDNKDSHGTQFTVSVDASTGITTGVSALDRWTTFKILGCKNSKPADLSRPGHIFPLVSATGGLSERRGHTEAGVELAKICGSTEVMIISELYNKMTGKMMTLHECSSLGLHVIHIDQIKQGDLGMYPLWCDIPVQKIPQSIWNLAIIDDCKVFRLKRGGQKSVMLRIHSECFTGDVLGSSLCDCGNQLTKSMEMINEHGNGLIIFPNNHEGRGIGLAEKIKAYNLQRTLNIDTFEANLKLGHSEDMRSFSNVLGVLRKTGIGRDVEICLLTENPEKIRTLTEEGYKIKVVSLDISPTDHNRKYMADKKQHFGKDTSHQVAKTKPPALSIDENDRERLKTLKICMVHSSWHSHYIDMLKNEIRGILNTRFGICQIEYIAVPGSFELPKFIKNHSLKSSKNVYIAIGILVKGDTDHYDFVARETTAQLARLPLENDIWVVNGLLTCLTMEQVKQRCDSSYELCVASSLAEAAVRCGLEMMK